MAYVQRALSKTKLATKIIGIEKKENAKATIFKLLQQKFFVEKIKSLPVKKEVQTNRKTLQFSHFIDNRGHIRSKSSIGKNQLDFNAKHPLLLH